MANLDLSIWTIQGDVWIIFDLSIWCFLPFFFSKKDGQIFDSYDTTPCAPLKFVKCETHELAIRLIGSSQDETGWLTCKSLVTLYVCL